MTVLSGHVGFIFFNRNNAIVPLMIRIVNSAANFHGRKYYTITMIMGYIMKYLQFDTLGIAPEEVAKLKETYELLNYKYKTQFLGYRDTKNSNFIDVAMQADLAGMLIVQKQIRKSFLIFTKSQSRASKMNWNDRQGSDSSYQVRAFTVLRKDYGKVFIRRKSLIDRLIDAFTAISIVFKNDKAFTSKFYVVADSNERVDELMNQDFRDLIMNFSREKFLINIVNRTLIVEYAHGLNPQKTANMAELACAMSIL